MSDRESVGHTFLKGHSFQEGRMFLKRLRRFAVPGAPGSPEVTDMVAHYGGDEHPDRAVRNTPMVDPSDVQASEAVRRAADERIRQEAMRQLDSIELDDEDVDGRIEPLEKFESAGFFDDLKAATDAVVENDNIPSDDVTWDEVSGRFRPEDDVYFNRS